MQYTYKHTRPNYVGSPYLQEYRFDAELLGTVIKNLKHGKASGLDTLTAEHLQYAHYVLPCLLAKLFNLIILPLTAGVKAAPFRCLKTKIVINL